MRRSTNSADRCAIIALLGGVVLHGCALPLPTDVEGISNEKLVMIELGNTTREEVVAILGQPDLIWETEHVLVYKERPAVRLLWIIPGGYTSAVGISDLGNDVVLLQFDTSNRVQRLEKRSGVIDGEFMRRWVAEKVPGQPKSK